MNMPLFISDLILLTLFCACDNANNDGTIHATSTIFNNEAIQEVLEKRKKGSLVNVENTLKNKRKNSLQYYRSVTE